jgi:hypothetical protein
MLMSTTRQQNQRLWVGLDQIASSATSFACSALAAGLLSAQDFGAWAVAFTIGVLILTATRTWCGDALMIVAPANSTKSAAHSKGSISLAFCLGMLGALVLATAAATVRGSAQAALLALAIGLPAVLMQDACRYTLLAQRRGRSAFANDALWLTLSCTSLMALRRADTDSVFLSMLAWSSFAIPSVVLGMKQTGARLSLRAARGWVRSVRYLSSRLFAEYVIFMASSLLALTVVIGVVGDIELAGSLRGAQVLMGPITILLAASTTYLQPLMVVDHSHGQSIIGRGRTQSLLVVFITVLWVATLLLVPDSAGTRVFGFTWFGARSELLAVGTVFCFVGASVGAINVLRCTGRVSKSLRAHAILAGIVIIGAIVGAAIDGSDGAVVGFALSSVAGPLLLWQAALREESRPHLSDERSETVRHDQHVVARPSASAERHAS